MSKIYLGLVHYPNKNKVGDKVCTSVTNLDIHDIARSCRTFGIEKYYIITPLVPQQQLVQRILNHWQKEESSIYNPDRYDAFSVVLIKDSIESALADVELENNVKPLIAVTGASFGTDSVSICDMLLKIQVDNRPCLLLFGTGSGLHSDVLESADIKVDSINGASKDGYNHLSVRSAVAIYLDRISQESVSRL